MRKSRPCFRIAALVSFAFVFVTASGCSEAETITVKCDAPLEMTLVYEGDDSGTMTVTDSSGAFSLPASLERRKSEVDGKLIKAMGIRADGAVSTIMPDKATVEECIKGKVSTDLLADPDVVFTTAMGCGTSVAPGKDPVEINANVEITVLDPPEAYVFVTRTYAEPTTLGDGTIELTSMPPPQCVVTE